MELPTRTVRLDPAEVARVYEARPELAGVDVSRLLRIGLVMLAGHSLTLDDAMKMVPRRKPGSGSPSAERNRAKASAAA